MPTLESQADMLHSLTPRRLQALAALRELHAGTGSAVHYSSLAGRMGISVWTAYDLLLELEKLGLVRRSYNQDPHPSQRRGRSRILFVPTAAEPVAGGTAGPGLSAAFERFSAIRDEATAARAYLASSSEEITSSLAFNMGFWLARLQAAGRHGGEAARLVLDGGTAPLLKAQTVAAMGLGSALARLGRSRLAATMTTAAAAFSALLEEASRNPEGPVPDLVEATRRLELN
jgi:hypothetical protein